MELVLIRSIVELVESDAIVEAKSHTMVCAIVTLIDACNPCGELIGRWRRSDRQRQTIAKSELHMKHVDSVYW